MCEPALHEELAWLKEWRGRREIAWLLPLLDSFTPLAPLGAQMLLVAQPAIARWDGKRKLTTLARALESPNGVQLIRQLLDPSLEKSDTIE